jgi:hypothetical protein
VEEILNKQHGYSGLIVPGLTIAIVAIVVIVSLISNNHASSSAGVITVSDYEATISKGDTLILTSKSGKTTNYWYVTFDGKQTVTMKRESRLLDFASSPEEHSEKLCGVNCERHMNVRLFQGVTIIERADHRVGVKWTWQWGYRRH